MISVPIHSLWLSTDHGITLLPLGLVCLLTNKVKLTPYGIFTCFRSATLLGFLKNLRCCWCALFSGKTLLEYDINRLVLGLLYNERSYTSQECPQKKNMASHKEALLHKMQTQGWCRRCPSQGKHPSMICWSHSWKGHASLQFASRLVRKPVLMRGHTFWSMMILGISEVRDKFQTFFIFIFRILDRLFLCLRFIIEMFGDLRIY